jgi:hypothetical protein
MRLRLVGATWLLASVLGCDSAPPATAAQQAERFVAALNADSVDAARATWSTSTPQWQQKHHVAHMFAFEATKA